MENILHALCFVIFQIQNDFGFGNVQDTFTEPTPIQISNILRGGNGRAAVTPDDFKNLLYPLTCKCFGTPGAMGVIVTDQFPRFVNKDRFLFCAILLGFVPDIRKNKSREIPSTYFFFDPKFV